MRVAVNHARTKGFRVPDPNMTAQAEALKAAQFARLLEELLQMRSELMNLRTELLRLISAQPKQESPTASVHEACQILGCERTKLFELLRTGQLARADTPGRKVRITRASLNVYLAAHQAPVLADVSGEARRLLARPRAGLSGEGA